MTNSIDPLGRSRSFIYSTNLIDLLEVRQQTGPSTSDSLASFSYNTQHLPLTVVDASGKTNSFTYNAHGQLLTFTDSLGETTTLSYSSDGFLLNIDGPLPGTNDSTYFTYDAFGRRRTVTGPDGYTLQFDYDPLDRVTVITYPDGTYRQFEYNKLDLASVRDRLGRRSLFSYNSLRQILEATDPLNRITRFGWCDCGRSCASMVRRSIHAATRNEASIH